MSFHLAFQLTPCLSYHFPNRMKYGYGAALQTRLHLSWRSYFLALAISDSVAPGGWQSGFRFSGLKVEGKPPIPAGSDETGVGRTVTPDYFHALDIPIIRGRDFTEQDRAGNDGEVILSRFLATKLFGNEDPIDKRFGTTGIHGDASSVVVGIADNVKNNGLTAESEPEIYSLRRNIPLDWDSNKFVIILSSVMPARTVEPWVHSAIASIDPTIPAEVQVLDQTVNRLADRPRFETALLTFFAFAGLALAIVGLYGLMAFLTTQRTHEIGIRMALGATRENILRFITVDGLRMVSVGAAIGLTAALAISRLLKTLIFYISPADPLTFVLVPIILSVVALIAILIPARAGTRVDPTATLRAE